jgi:hypothetical protein
MDPEPIPKKLTDYTPRGTRSIRRPSHARRIYRYKTGTEQIEMSTSYDTDNSDQQVTSQSRVFHEKLTVVQLVKKVHYYVHNSPLLYPILKHPVPTHKKRYILILSAHLILGLWSGRLASVFQNKSQYVCLVFPYTPSISFWRKQFILYCGQQIIISSFRSQYP